MMSIFDPTLALTLLTHPLQVALVAVTLGALARQGIFAWVAIAPRAIDRATTIDVNVRAAA